MAEEKIACPKCDCEPDGRPYWMCDSCFTAWNTFETAARCPSCSKQFKETQCIPGASGCGQISPHIDWYRDLDNWLEEELAKIKEQELVASLSSAVPALPYLITPIKAR